MTQLSPESAASSAESSEEGLDQGLVLNRREPSSAPPNPRNLANSRNPPNPPNPAPSPLHHGYLWALLGNLAHAAAGWAVLAVLARLGSPELVGQFALALAFAAPALMLTGLQLRAILATDAASRFAFGDYFRLRLLGSSLSLALVLGLTWGLGYSFELFAIIGAVCLARAVESLSDVSHGLFQRQERLDLLGRSLLFRAPLSVAALAFALMLFGSLRAGTLALVVSALSVLCLHDLRWSAALLGDKKALWRRSSSGISHLARTGAPLGVAALLSTLCSSIPRWVLERSAGEFELGIFAALSYFVVAGTLLVTTLGQSAAARLASLWTQGEKRAIFLLLAKLSTLAFGAALAGLFIATFFGELLLNLLYGPDFAPYAKLLQHMMLAGLVAYPAVICGFALTAMGQFRAQVPQMGAALLATSLGALWWIPSHGVSGAVWAMIAGFAAQLGLGLVVLAGAWREGGVKA